MASAKAKIRHVFGDTFSCRAAPPDILVKLSDSDQFTVQTIVCLTQWFNWNDFPNSKMACAKTVKE